MGLPQHCFALGMCLMWMGCSQPAVSHWQKVNPDRPEVSSPLQTFVLDTLALRLREADRWLPPGVTEDWEIQVQSAMVQSLNQRGLSLSLDSAPLRQGLERRVDRTLASPLRFRGIWPLPEDTMQSKEWVLRIHSLDLGVDLNASTLYDPNHRIFRELEVDSLGDLVRAPAGQKMQLWTCWTLWNGMRNQYVRYGCFEQVLVPPAQAVSQWSSAKFWEAWSGRLLLEVQP